MAKDYLYLSEYRAVWLFTMFDLPVDSKAARKRYREFRNILIKNGFTQIQYSIYARYFRTEERSQPIRNKIKQAIPADGYVRLMLVTDKQFGKMECFYGKKRRKNEAPPGQLSLF